jgi:hypothetical protein
MDKVEELSQRQTIMVTLLITLSTFIGVLFSTILPILYFIIELLFGFDYSYQYQIIFFSIMITSLSIPVVIKFIENDKIKDIELIFNGISIDSNGHLNLVEPKYFYTLLNKESTFVPQKSQLVKRKLGSGVVNTNKEFKVELENHILGYTKVTLIQDKNDIVCKWDLQNSKEKIELSFCVKNGEEVKKDLVANELV